METQDNVVEYMTQQHEEYMAETQHDVVEQFQCIICLELVYKPIVHACGHLFCFWCVHRAMNGAYKNLCPLCRRPYMHFPRICEQLHFVLLKAMHDKYLIRAKEVLEEEAQGGIFSPELPPRSTRPQHENPPEEEAASTTDTETISASNLNSAHGSTLSNSSSSSNGGDEHPTDLVSSKGKAPMADDESERKQESPPDTANCVTVLDLACLHCSHLLYRPVVLNCGHMFCEHCVVVGDNNTLSCPSCKAEHPGIFPQVCLELHHYIDRIFPLEYAHRSLQVAREKREQPRHRPQLPPSEPEDPIKGRIRKPVAAGPVHRTIGCDGCGMMPIVGKRFRCQDCPEQIGFDLCGKCYDSGIVLGRFNQGHTSQHGMVEVRLPSRGSSIARRFLDVIANRTLIMDGFRAIANDCNEAEALQHLVDGSNGVMSGTESARAQATPSAATEVEEEDDGGGAMASDRVETYVLQDGDGDDHHLHEDFLHNNGGDDNEGEFDGQDDEEFEAFSRDDEDIFRVVFHS